MKLLLTFDLREVHEDGSEIPEGDVFDPATTYIDLPPQVTDLLRGLDGLAAGIDNAQGVTATQLANAQSEYAEARRMVAQFFDAAGQVVARYCLTKARAHFAEPEPEPETMGRRDGGD